MTAWNDMGLANSDVGRAPRISEVRHIEWRVALGLWMTVPSAFQNGKEGETELEWILRWVNDTK